MKMTIRFRVFLDIKRESSMNTENNKKVKIYPEKMTAEDICGVAEIEKLCFGSAAWSQNSLELLTKDGIGMGMVCRKDGKVVAYGGMLVVVDEGQITNVATHPDYRRQGYGAAVVDALKKYGPAPIYRTKFIRFLND